MGANESKLRCLFLPAQSGKTRKVEEEITIYKQICGLDGGRSIDIFISANNRLLVFQTTARVRRDLGAPISEDDDSYISDSEENDAVIKGNIFSWTCGKGPKIIPDHLACQVLLDEVEMVIMCAHKLRMRYLNEMLCKLISKQAFRKNPVDINIWIDEADSSMKLWMQFPEILNIPAVKNVTLVSATFTSVLKHFGRIHVIPYKITHPACYRRLKDCRQVVMDKVRGAVGFLNSVFEAYPGLLTPGMKIFAPGNCPRVSHEEIASRVTELGGAVLIINGKVKELRIPEQPPHDMRPYLSANDPFKIPEEFNGKLASLYKSLQLYKYPFFITGYLCVQRGVTLQCPPTEEHDGFLLDGSIIPSISYPDEAYQTMARNFGNIGDFTAYKPPTIYSTSEMFENVRDREEAAVNLPKIVHQEELADITIEDFKRAECPPDNKTYRIHITEEEHIGFYELILGSKPRTGDFQEQTEGAFAGFRLSTSVSQLPLSVSTAIMKGASNVGGEWTRRRYPCYKDVRDPSTLRWLFMIPAGTNPATIQKADALYPDIVKRGD